MVLAITFIKSNVPLQTSITLCHLPHDPPLPLLLFAITSLPVTSRLCLLCSSLLSLNQHVCFSVSFSLICFRHNVDILEAQRFKCLCEVIVL